MSFRRILSYRWYDYMSNDLVVREAGLRQISCIVRERQRLPAEDPAHQIFSCRNPRGWTMPRGRPKAPCLRQVEHYLGDTGMAGLGSAWAMARWTGRRAASAFAPIIDLT